MTVFLNAINYFINEINNLGESIWISLLYMVLIYFVKLESRLAISILFLEFLFSKVILIFETSGKSFGGLFIAIPILYWLGKAVLSSFIVHKYETENSIKEKKSFWNILAIGFAILVSGIFLFIASYFLESYFTKSVFTGDEVLNVYKKIKNKIPDLPEAKHIKLI